MQSLSSKHEKIERDKEREKRKCNLLIGNIAEEELVSDTTTKSLVEDLFQNKLKLELTPLQATRIGKKVDTKNRLILVKMNSMAEKIEVLKAAKLLKDTIIYIHEDLSFNERKRRKALVAEIKKAREDGKRAFIRFSDGNLMVDGAQWWMSPPQPLIMIRTEARVATTMDTIIHKLILRNTLEYFIILSEHTRYFYK